MYAPLCVPLYTVLFEDAAKMQMFQSLYLDILQSQYFYKSVQNCKLKSSVPSELSAL